MFQLAVLASGRGSNLQAIINKLHLTKKDIKISCVISNNKIAKALKIAKNYEIPFYLIDENRYNSNEYEEILIKKAQILINLGFIYKLCNIKILMGSHRV